MKKIFVIGSCVSRDIFNAEGSKENFLVDGYIPRSSLASLLSSSPFEDEYTANLSSDFQKRIVHADIVKLSEKKIQESHADYFLIDLIDERFNLIKTNTGICTLSDELKGTGITKNMPGSVIESGGDEFFDLWQKGWMKLLYLFENKKSREKIILNKVFWANCTKSGEKFNSIGERIKNQNNFLGRMYEVIESDLNPRQVINFPSDVLLAADEHRWGRSPFHYCDEYYAFALNFLKKL